MKNKRLVIIFTTVAILLLIPLIAMQFTDEITWTGTDFVIMGILLLGTGLICNLVTRKVIQNKYSIALYIIILGIVLLIWAELAVGILGTPFAGS